MVETWVVEFVLIVQAVAELVFDLDLVLVMMNLSKMNYHTPVFCAFLHKIDVEVSAIQAEQKLKLGDN